MTNQTTKNQTKDEALQEHHLVERYATGIIRKARKLHKVSLKDLEQDTGLSQQQLNKIELGTNRLRAGTLFQIASRLKIPLFFCFPSSEDHASIRPDIGRLAHARIIYRMMNVLFSFERLEDLESAYSHICRLHQERWK